MASGEDWNPEQMLQLYLYDYMVKKKMHKAAAIFKKEVKIPDNHTLAINDSRQGFICDWWSMFYTAFVNKYMESQEEKEAASLLAMQMEEIKRQLRDQTVVPQIITDQQSAEQLSGANEFDKQQFWPSEPDATNLIEHVTSQSDIDFDQPDVENSVPTSPSNVVAPMIEEAQVQENGISLERPSSPMDPEISSLLNDFLLTTEQLQDEGMSEGVNPVALNGSPANGPNGEQQIQELALTEYQQPLSLQRQPCTPARQTFGPGNPANFCTMSRRHITGETGGKDQLANSEIMSSKFQNGRKKNGALRLKTREIPSDHMKAMGNGFAAEKVDSNVSLDGENDKSPDIIVNERKRDSTDGAEIEIYKDFSFNEVACHLTSKKELVCCDFSSDGKLLASAGVERKVFVWNVETSCHSISFERHRDPITDIRFKPSSTIVATSSLDHTVKVWDAARPKRAHHHLQGHADQVMSIDFHPRNINLLCSCDYKDEIRFWVLADSPTCIHTFKGAKKQVRFQPNCGKFLATASDNVVALFDAETKTRQLSWKAHDKDVLSICWHKNGKYILSVSEDNARLWSIVSGGKCIRELHAKGKEFHSCTFHPGNERLWIIGGYQLMELWDPECHASMVVPSHQELVAGLAQSKHASMVASVSHEGSAKLWI